MKITACVCLRFNQSTTCSLIRFLKLIFYFLRIRNGRKRQNEKGSLHKIKDIDDHNKLDIHAAQKQAPILIMHVLILLKKYW